MSLRKHTSALKTLKQVFFKGKCQVQYLVWTCRGPISLFLGIRFSLILGTWFSVLGTQIGPLKHCNKPCTRELFKRLALWELGYDIFVLRNRPKISSCQLPYQCQSSSADCTRELFKGLNALASLLVCTRKKIFYWELQIFCEWRHKWSSFWAILAHVPWPGAQPLGQSISLKFSLQTKLESESFVLSLWSTF